MLRTRADYNFDTFNSAPDSTYKIGPNDIINVRVMANNGAGMINIVGNQGSSGVSTIQNNTNTGTNSLGIPISVEYDGTAKIPIIGRIKVEGFTRRELENKLEGLFANDYNDPYVVIRITNRQVIVFPGEAGKAQVVPFARENMNLFEALASVGGISENGKARNIKLIRGDYKNPQVYKIDLSTIDGMKQADLALQSGDVIYVTPSENAATLFVKNAQPYLATISTISAIATTVALIISISK